MKTFYDAPPKLEDPLAVGRRVCGDDYLFLSGLNDQGVPLDWRRQFVGIFEDCVLFKPNTDQMGAITRPVRITSGVRT